MAVFYRRYAALRNLHAKFHFYTEEQSINQSINLSSARKQYKYNEQLENIRDVFSPLAHPTIAILELRIPFDGRMTPPKFRDDISNGSRVNVLTDKQTNEQSHKQTLLKAILPSLRYAVRGCNQKPCRKCKPPPGRHLGFCCKSYFMSKLYYCRTAKITAKFGEDILNNRRAISSGRFPVRRL